MLRLVLDMETGDPDDFVTLLLLLGHPRVDLIGVTVNPGSADQIGLVRWALARFEAAIPVGARDLDSPKQHVSSWHQHYGPWSPSRDAEPAGRSAGTARCMPAWQRASMGRSHCA